MNKIVRKFMKKQMNVFFAYVLCLCFISTFLPCEVLVLAANAALDETLSGYELVAEDKSIALYLQPSNNTIAVLDKSNGYVWNQAVVEEMEGISNFYQKGFVSMAVIEYVNICESSGTNKVDPLAALSPKTTKTNIKNGIRFDYNIEDINLKLAIEVTVEDGNLVCRIPSNSVIEEEGTEQVIIDRLAVIWSLIEDSRGLIDDIKKDKEAAKLLKKDIAAANGFLGDIEYVIDGVASPVGIQTLIDVTREYLNKLLNVFLGGESYAGIFTAAAESDKIGTELKDKLTAAKSSWESAQKKAINTLTALKTLKVARIVSVSLMPYFGSASDNDKGYVFYPDGSGAINYFKKDHPKVLNEYYKGAVYSDDSVDISWEREINASGAKRVYLPIFGIKKDNNAFIAAITNGDMSASIEYYPSGYIFNLNRANASFLFRRQTEDASSGGIYTGFSRSSYEKQRIIGDIEVKYMFLSGDNADYSGMANQYREYLIKNGELTKNPVLDEGMPLALDIFAGIYQRRLIIDKYLKLTTYGEALEMLKYLTDNGVSNVLLNMSGWSVDGYDRYPSKTSLSGKLGGKGDFKELSEFTADNGIPFYLQDNYFENYRYLKRFSNEQLAYNSSNRVFNDFYLTINIFSPRYILEKLTKTVLPEFKSYGVTGISFERAGTFLYYDYNAKHFSQREETAEIVGDMLSKTKEELGGAAVFGGNKYVLKYADWLLDIPNDSTRYFYSDYSIPFYQMVVHGSIPYTSNMNNQFYEPEQQLLKMLEYGAVPYYKVTWSDGSQLNDVPGLDLFSSYFELYKKEMVDLYKTLNADFSHVANKKIIKHEIITNDLRKVRYEDGTVLYVNYAGKPASIDGVTVAAVSYKVIRGGK